MMEGEEGEAQGVQGAGLAPEITNQIAETITEWRGLCERFKIATQNNPDDDPLMVVGLLAVHGFDMVMRRLSSLQQVRQR